MSNIEPTNVTIVAALEAIGCEELAARLDEKSIDESIIEPLQGDPRPSVKFYRHVLQANGTVVGEVIVIFIPQH